jgi:hypothetical protein
MANFKVECKSSPAHWKHDYYAQSQSWNINNRQDADDKIEHIKSVHKRQGSSKVLIMLNDKKVFQV